MELRQGCTVSKREKDRSDKIVCTTKSGEEIRKRTIQGENEKMKQVKYMKARK